MNNNHNNNTKHNLNINTYSFDEILDLFNLTNANNITVQQLKDAKKIVLKMHPDKSRLPPEYFLFYKKAFEIIVDFFNNQNKVNVQVPTTEIKYSVPTNISVSNFNKSTEKKIQTTIETMKPEQFQKTFNELFEKNNMGKKIINKNEWFSNDEPVFNTSNIQITNANNINTNIEKMKEKQQGMVIYKGVKEMQLSLGGVSTGDLYEDLDDEKDENIYIETDPFSKLKFEDLKKVHKNETVFSISEKEFDNVQKYNNVEQYVKSRDTIDIQPMTKTISEEILKKKDEEIRNKIIKKEYEMKKKQTEYENKNKSILSYFLQIT